MRYCVCILSLCGLLSASLVYAQQPSKEQLYLQALAQYKSKKYNEASQLFHKALALFRKAQAGQKKGSRLWHQYALGQGDILLRLADVAQQQGQPRRSCRLRQRIDVLRRTLPKQWRQWVSRSALPKRFDRSTLLLNGACATVPSVVTFVLAPSMASVSLQGADGKWRLIKANILSTTKQKVQVKISAKGFVAAKQVIEVARWSTKTVEISLVAAPKIRKRTKPRPTSRRVVKPPPPRRKLPPPPPPVYKTWWFWTITGVVVAGGTTAIVLAATAQTSLVLKGNGSNGAYKVW